MKRVTLNACLFVALCGGRVWSDSPLNEEEVNFFESKIRPVLVEQCYRCHSSEEKIRGGLSIDSREGILHGGDSGPAIVPGNLSSSLLWTAITWTEEDYEMPPKKKLPANVIADFKKWIEMGAPDPRVTESGYVKSEIDIEKGKEFWSFKKPVRKQLPKINDEAWPVSETDHFVLARLDLNGLTPAADAKPEILLRRLYFDLIGLPPTPKDIKRYAAAWKRDPKKTYRQEVEKLLSSEGFGERWGRHWLDVARYAESSGKDINMTFPHAWRYRDYVIDSFNADKPYDKFIIEQIAGDLLPIKNDEDWQENLVATGFLAMGPKNLNERDPRQFALDLADEQIDTTTQSILGLTVSCARCHDHKSDPIPTTDYYSLAGVFINTKTYFGTVNAVQNRRGTKLLELPIPDKESIDSLSSNEMSFIKNRLAESEERLQDLTRQAREDRLAGRSGNAQQQALRLRTQISQMKGRLNSVDENGESITRAMGVQDREEFIQPVVLIRGELDKPAQEVELGFPKVLCDEPVKLPKNSSGRLEFAKWLSSKNNPLTARVMVNRVWGHLFGSSIVTSQNNFGSTGQAPTHPELLDHLAVKFMEDNWSIKSLIRELVLTRTYQMSSTHNHAAYNKDPENLLQWRHSPKKIDAEALRDSMLIVSGKLNAIRPVGSEIAWGGDNRVGGFRPPRNNSSLERPINYRSVYLPAARDSLPEALALFDPADPNIVTGKREQTNVPDQALYLMNNKFVLEQAEGMALRVYKGAKTDRERVANAFAIAFSRPATNQEVDAALAYMRNFIVRVGPDSQNRQKTERLALITFCQSLLISAEFRYLN